MDRNLGAPAKSLQRLLKWSLLAGGWELGLPEAKGAKADAGLRSSCRVKLVAHVGRMLRAHLGRTPTCSAQGWEQPGCPSLGNIVLFVSCSVQAQCCSRVSLLQCADLLKGWGSVQSCK